MHRLVTGALDHQTIGRATSRHRDGLAAIGAVAAAVRDLPGSGDEDLRAGTVGDGAGGCDENIGLRAGHVARAAGRDDRPVECKRRAARHSFVGRALNHQTIGRATSRHCDGLAAVGVVIAAIHNLPRLGDKDLRAGPIGNGSAWYDENIAGCAGHVAWAAGRDDGRIEGPGRAARDGFVGRALNRQTIGRTASRHCDGLAAVGAAAAAIHDLPRLGDKNLRAGAVGHDAGRIYQDVCESASRRSYQISAASRNHRRIEGPRRAARDGFVGRALNRQTIGRAASRYRYGLAAVGAVAAAIHDLPRLGDKDLRAGAVGHGAGRIYQHVCESTSRRLYQIGAASRNHRRIEGPRRATRDGFVGRALNHQTIGRATSRHRYGLTAVGAVVAAIHDLPVLRNDQFRAGAVGDRAGRGNQHVGDRAVREDKPGGAASGRDRQVEHPGGAARHRLVRRALDLQAGLAEGGYCKQNVTKDSAENGPHSCAFRLRFECSFHGHDGGNGEFSVGRTSGEGAWMGFHILSWIASRSFVPAIQGPKTSHQNAIPLFPERNGERGCEKILEAI